MASMLSSKIRTCLLLTLVWTVILLNSCRSPEERKSRDPSAEKLEEQLLDANKQLAKIEASQIDDYIRRHKLDMQETGTGLCYWIDGQGYGLTPGKGDLVRLQYTVCLLTGDTLYSSGKDGLLIFRVGHGETISGLEEGILLLREGDQAKFIIPSHLAYGLIGDQNKIHEKVSLVYDLKLLSVERNK